MKIPNIDPYFYEQPSLSFVEELKKPLHEKKPKWFGRTELREGETLVSGMFLLDEFPDQENLLETAVEDFLWFLKVYEIEGNRYPVRLMKRETECFEAYRIRIADEECTIEADDTEGIRRALIFLEDEMHRREGPVLPLGEICRKPSIKTRITRGFFSPTNRPPKNQDELFDDVDYYPDEYLNRLAHDGTNGLWIYTHFKELLPSDHFMEYGRGWEKRIEKLQSVVKKCSRYGIKVYVFGVEPSALPPEMAEKYRDCVGYPGWNGDYTICTHTKHGKNYCIEMTQRLFELVPGLGGVIDITEGERVTTCSSAREMYRCPRCGKYTRSQVLAYNTELFREGMRRAGSSADFIGWTYHHREWDVEEIREYVRLAPRDVMLMENFEDAGYSRQLGKTRQAIDYWLSYVGPSQMFEAAAQTAAENGKHMFAKMQVCCSHELATVPYIPAPGILFDKYAGAHKYGVEGVMQCWYFGNYPSLMSKAAGELSFMDDFSDKRKFLEHLAGIYYGGGAKEAATAWEHFEKGYLHYPLNIMFSYYGPMHDGVVWELALLPKNRPLSRSWLLMDRPDGDRIGESLQSGHTLEEAIQLTDIMRKEWECGLSYLPPNGPSEQLSVAQALRVLFTSGNHILKFYQLREMLGKGIGYADTLLKQMEELTDAEMNCSREMLELCNADSRLGYHSEAEGYKFFPQKLQDRIEKLKVLKETEFVAVRRRILEGKEPLAYYQGKKGPSYMLKKGEIGNASYEKISKDAVFRASYGDESLFLELKGTKNSRFVLYFEFELLWPSPGIVIEDGKIKLAACALSHQSVFAEKIQTELEKYQLLQAEPQKGAYLLAISRKGTGWTADKPLKARIEANGVSWIREDAPVHTLGKPDASPGEFGWFLPREN